MVVFRLSAAAILAAISVTAYSTPVGAKTVDILQQSPDLFTPEGGTASERRRARGNFPNVYGGAAPQRVFNQSFGQYQLKQRDTGSGDPFTNFVAFCVDLTTVMATSDTVVTEYETPGTVFTYGDAAIRRQLIGTLFVNEWDPAAGLDHQAAMQMTLWKIAHGDVSSPAGDAFDLTARSYDGLGGRYFDYYTDIVGDPLVNDMADKFPAVTALASSWLEALDGDGLGDWTQSVLDQIGVAYYTSADSQTVVSYVPPNPGPPPVPLPAGFLLLASALGLGGALRRRRAG